MPNVRLCSIEGCGKKHEGNGFCYGHGSRWKRHGYPLGGAASDGKPWEFIESALNFEQDACLIWPYGKNDKGYGSIAFKGTTKGVHRIICEKVNGIAPSPKHQAAHSCGKGHLGCVSPKHLRWATRSENASDSVKHGTSQKKITRADADEIRKLQGTLSQKSIGLMFGIAQTTVSRILRRDTHR